MNELRSLPPGTGGLDLGSLGGADQAAPESPFAIFQRVHRLLRGRYLYVISFGILGAIAGLVGGYMSTRPKYESVGLIHIRPTLPKTMYDTELSRMPEMFASYVQTQANLLQETRVIHQAMKSAEWRSLGRSFEPEDIQQFKDSLSVVTTNQQPEWIRVKFADENPTAARVAVQQVIAAYTDIYGNEVILLDPKRINELKSKKTVTESDIRQLKERINKIGDQFQTNDLKEPHKESLEQLFAIERQVSQLDSTLQQAKAAQAAQPEPKPEPTREADLDAAIPIIAKTDEQMRSLLNMATAAQTSLESLRARFTDTHRDVIQARSMAEASRRQLHDYARKWIIQNGGLVAGSGLSVIPSSPEAIALMESQLASLIKLRDEARDRAALLKDSLTRITDLQAEVASKTQFLSEVDKRLTQLDTEQADVSAEPGIFGRIRIVSSGEEAYRPAFDSRKKRAAAGFLVGGGLPFGFFLLLGLLDRRYRYSDDAADGRVRPTLLGILPYLPERLRDPEQASVAAHCVHQIRTLLQIGGLHQDRRVFAITSPTSGDGKTSLSLSLGLSFATSGARTCLIDFDMIGGGLTNAMQAKTSHGLMDAINQGELNGHIKPTGFPNLSLIPIGIDDAQDVSRLSPELVRRVINQAREQFDIVVIDTGPILGSIEASLVSAAADGVILTVGRGQARPQAERAMEYLGSLGATLMGVVFNRADAGDFRRAVSSTSVRSVPNQNGRGGRILPALGPMASTLAADFDPEPSAQ